MQARFRKDYDGEFVISNTTIRNGRKIQTREWVPNPIVNQHISGRAAVIGSGQTARPDVITHLSRHPGGLLGKKKLQTYGCETAWQSLPLDFYIDYNVDTLAKIVNQTYQKNTIVYTHSRNCLTMPGNFYMVPYNVRTSSPATAVYLAAFDGHREIFLLGIDGTNQNHAPDSQYIHDVNQVIQAYNTVTFRFVTDGMTPPTQWQAHRNVEVWKYSKFISYCDV
jgi:hypothetical protein